MIVDAEDLQRWMIQTVLTHHGYRALEAKNVDEAIALSANTQHPIHVLLIDVAVAGQRAAETVARIRHGRAELQPIFMARGANIELARELWLLPLVRKPLGVRTLLTTLRAVLDGR